MQAQLAQDDTALDLPPANAVVHDAPDRRVRLRFGPQIFPSSPSPMPPFPNGQQHLPLSEAKASGDAPLQTSYDTRKPLRARHAFPAFPKAARLEKGPAAP